MTAMVTRRGALSMQVCVPNDWDDDRVKIFADRENPCGTENGWAIRKEGDPSLNGDLERSPCSNGGGMVHVTLDA
jgi:hypothetical protein